MDCKYEDGLYYLRVPGALLYSENKDLLWPSYMTLAICMPKELREAQANNETLHIRCVE
tara:strand:+ start:34338 stop:34514 length:177 start_codon:yes stop_codon:yes gene_type:complete